MDTRTVNRRAVYPVAGFAPESVHLTPEDRRNLRAQWTGEPRRMIGAGEWYLSGAEVTAYRAAGEVGPFHPARLVVAVPVTTYELRALPRIEVPSSLVAATSTAL